MKRLKVKRNGKRRLVVIHSNGHHRPHPVLATLVMKCGHCRSMVQHAITYCGQYRVCAICEVCGWHRRLGGRIPIPYLSNVRPSTRLGGKGSSN